MQTLNEIGLKHVTDQANFHNYCDRVYEPLIKHLRHEPIRMLEIGTLFGSSIKMWCEYFSQGHVVGMDVKDEIIGEKPANYTHLLGSSNNTQDLFRVSALGPFDLIFDDGSHQSLHIITAFEYLFRHALKPGGIYFATDLHAVYLPEFNTEPTPCTAVNFFKALVDKVNWHGAGQCGDPNKTDGVTLDYWEQSIDSIAFYKSVCVIKKR